MDSMVSVPLIQVAQRIGVSERVILYWARHGQIPGAFQVGYKEWHISRADLNAWLKERGDIEEVTPRQPSTLGVFLAMLSLLVLSTHLVLEHTGPNASPPTIHLCCSPTAKEVA